MKAFRRFQLDWRAKAAAFRVFDRLPGGQTLYYLTQRYVTRTLPRNPANHLAWQVEHAATFRAHFAGELSRATLFEFGAGVDLLSNLVHWCYGIDDQIVVDITPLARQSHINIAIQYLRDHPPPGAARVPERLLSTRSFGRELQRTYGIDYRAPADARHTGLPTGSVDVICTTSVLEHVPSDVLRDILTECRRISRPGAISSHVVDYTDHYAHSDPSITIYNFLGIADARWARYNPGIHYQNRLRHGDYRRLFEAAGFAVEGEVVRQPEAAEALLATVKVTGRFAALPVSELLPATGHWVLRAPEAPAAA